MEDDQNECQIIEVPVDDNGAENQSVEIEVKPRKRCALSESKKKKASANLSRAREIAKKNRELNKKLREQITQEYLQKESTDVEEEPSEPIEKLPRRYKKMPTKQELAIAYAHKAMKMEHKRTKGKGRPLTPRKKYISEEDYTDEEEASDGGWSSPEPVKRKGGRPKASERLPPKKKKVSEKEIRLSLLEKKLDEIIEHTRKMQVAPKVKNTKTTVIQMPAKQMDKQDQKMAKAAGTLLSLF